MIHPENELAIPIPDHHPIQASKTGIFAQRARVDQAAGLYYRKENLTF